MRTKRITNKKDIIINLFNKYYEAKDVINIQKLLKNIKFDLLNTCLIEINDPALILFILMAANKNKTSTIYRYLPDNLQDEIVKIATNNQIKIIFDNLYVDEILDIANRNPESFKKIIVNLSSEKRNHIKQIDGYEQDEAGSIMNPDFISLNSEWSIEECLKIIKKEFKNIEENLVFYVTGSSGILLGQVKLQDLFFANNYTAKVTSIMEQSFAMINHDDDIENVIELFKDYHFENVAVVNNDNELVGIITDNDILPAIEEEVTEDIYHMYGITKTDESYLKSSVLQIVKSRVLWVLILMISATLTSVAISLFEQWGDTLTSGLSTLLLVPIIPVINGASGNTGSQAFATIVRSLAIGEITIKDYKKVALKELQIGALLGFLLGIANTIRLCVYFAIPNFRGSASYEQSIYIALGTSLALWISVIFSKITAVSFPMIATKFNLDPTLMSGPINSTLLDLFSTSLLFSIGIGIMTLII